MRLFIYLTSPEATLSTPVSPPPSKERGKLVLREASPLFNSLDRLKLLGTFKLPLINGPKAGYVFSLLTQPEN